MSDPRWTVEIDADGGRYLHWSDLQPSDYGDLAALPPEAHNALVAAVRDADTLHQAREFAIDVTSVRRSHSFGIATAEMVTIVEQRLLDLLSSPAPDTGEKT